MRSKVTRAQRSRKTVCGLYTQHIKVEPLTRFCLKAGRETVPLAAARTNRAALSVTTRVPPLRRRESTSVRESQSRTHKFRSNSQSMKELEELTRGHLMSRSVGWLGQTDPTAHVIRVAGRICSTARAPTCGTRANLRTPTRCGARRNSILILARGYGTGRARNPSSGASSPHARACAHQLTHTRGARDHSSPTPRVHLVCSALVSIFSSHTRNAALRTAASEQAAGHRYSSGDGRRPNRKPTAPRVRIPASAVQQRERT